MVNGVTTMLALASLCLPEAAMTLRVDFSHPSGRLRSLNGVNKGPLSTGGWVDLSEQQKALGIPLTRLHDCHWPNPDVVDMHVVFPNPNADPDLPESYDFRLTDEYVAATLATGAKIVYRLGESIEHTSVKRFVHPPTDPNRWAKAALGIVRHYNEGWANGFHDGIRYWEIWNEPENRPVMWTGTDEEYFQLYKAAALALKAQDATLKIGGPSVGAVGTYKDEKFVPSPFVTAFLEYCRREKLPLDFFSWHCYTDSVEELAGRAVAIRRLLDSYGFTHAESHLNEWNYLPGNRWDEGSQTASPSVRQTYYETMSSVKGAAFIAAALLRLQDSPVDAGNFYHADTGMFGLFNGYGVPTKNYYAFLAFKKLIDTPHRVKVEGEVTGQLYAGAGLDDHKKKGSLLISSSTDVTREINVTVEGLPFLSVKYDLYVLDSTHNLERVKQGLEIKTHEVIPLKFEGPSVAWISFYSANG